MVNTCSTIMILNELKSGKVEFIKLTKSHGLAKKHQRHAVL